MKNRPTDDRGEPLISCREMALLIGVSETELKAHTATASTGVMMLPAEWVARGRERSRIYQQATGRDDMVSALEYWAAQQ